MHLRRFQRVRPHSTRAVGVRLAPLFLACPPLLLLGCGSSSPSGPDEVPVASVTIVEQGLVLPTRAQLQLTTLVKDDTGALLTGRSVTFQSSNAQVVSVDGSGMITASGAGTATITATAGGRSGSTGVSVHVLDFVAISGGWAHTCGLTAQGEAWCWGSHQQFQLGIGDAVSNGAFPNRVAMSVTLASLDVDGDTACGLTAQGRAYCWGPVAWGVLGQSVSETWLSPTAVPGDLTFESISVGTCGLVEGGAAYCWGRNDWGQSGNGNVLYHDGFVPVVGGLAFRQIEANQSYRCAITLEGPTYCWGRNVDGTLGVGRQEVNSEPTRLSGDLAFASIGSALSPTVCGITPEHNAYCWGWRGWTEGKEWNDSRTEIWETPTLVPGGVSFQSVDVGIQHACGLSVAGEALCWGDNAKGQLGDGSRTIRSEPTLVSGGHVFQQVTVGGDHACGLTISHEVYCWGDNSQGQLGAGLGAADSTVPILVHGSG